MLQPLPARRRHWTQEAWIGTVKVFLSVGEYEDGRPGEVFLDVALKGAGPDIRAWANCWAIAVSLALQAGTTVERIVGMFRDVRFDPSGLVRGEGAATHFAQSIPDFVARELEARYSAGSDKQAKQEPADDPPTDSSADSETDKA